MHVLGKQMTQQHEMYMQELHKVQGQIPAPTNEKYPCPYDGEVYDHKGIIDHIV